MNLFYNHSNNRSLFLKAGLICLMMIMSLFSQAQLTQDFSTGVPPSGWRLYSPTPMTTYAPTYNGYGSATGMGCVKVNFYDNMADVDSLVTPIINTTIAGDTVLFDHAHCEWPGYADSMNVFASSNGGTTWTRLGGLVGSSANPLPAVTLSTVPGGGTASYVPTAAQWKTSKFGIPVGSNRVSFVFYSTYGNMLYFDNVVITRNLPMVYDSTKAVQITDTVFESMNNAAVLNAKIYATYTGSPLPVTSFTANTAGTTSASDILAAKLYYSGTTAGFNAATATLLGTINNPSGVMSFTGFSQTLSGAVNNFWIVYDVAVTAVVGNVLDATFTSVVVSGSAKTPTVQNPAGSRYIQSYKNYRYCQWSTLSVVNYLSGPTNVTFGSINNSTADLNMLTSYASQTTELYKGDSAQIYVSIGPGNSELVGVYVDWNNNGTFELPAEQVVVTPYMPGGSTTGLPIAAPACAPIYIKVGCNVPPGYHRLRVVSDLSSVSACGPINYGDGEDYTLIVKPQVTAKAIISAVDTFYTNGGVTLRNLSVGPLITSQWDYQNDGTYDATTNNGWAQYPTNGTYTVKLKITSVGCVATVVDSAYKTIVIISPPSVTVANFISDKNVVSTSDIVTLYDLSTFGPGSWSWTISPANVGGNTAYFYQNGTTSSSPSPQLLFAEYGKYTVTLTATNVLGSSTITKSDYINVVRSTNMCSGGTTKTTNDDAGFLFDDGGKYANYTKGHDCFLLIKPGCAAQIQLKFNMFDISTLQWSGYPPGGDWIKVWDGTSNAGIPLHTAINWPAGIQNQIFNTPWIPPTLIATSGAMYIEYWTTGVGGQKGFDAEWSTVPIVGTTPPSVTFNVPDTIYTGVNGTYIATATGLNNSYDWDFNNDGIFDGSGISAAYTFTSPGSYTVKLVVSSCLGKTTLTKVVRVIAPTVAPVALFSANYTSGTPMDVFQLIDGSKNGPTTWNWTITPATYTVVAGTTTSQNLNVKFLAIGQYTVKLTVGNIYGTNSLTKTNYIKVFFYCTPNVNIMNTDIGISNVTFGDINNTTPQGLVGYNDYTSTLGTTTMELGATYPITIKRTSTVNAINRKVWIDLNGDGDFIDANETLFEETGSTSLSVTGYIKIPTNALIGSSRLRVGVNTPSSPNLGCGANALGEYEDYRISIIPDISKPVIKLNGTDTVSIEVGNVYNDLGATVSDNVTNPQTFTVTYNGFTNGTAFATTGTYTVTFNAVDSTGNLAITKTRTILVTPDVTKPVITLNGLDSVGVPVGTTFTDPGATANDFYFGPVTPVTVTGAVNTAVVGLYTLQYSAVDIHGNLSNIVKRKVYVLDLIKPVITVNGANPLLWDVHRKPFVDPGVTATDNYCTSGLTPAATSINLDSLGNYTITYSLKDCNGNFAVTKTRTVIVQDTVKPTLAFTVNTDVYLIEVLTLSAVPEPGYTKSDNYYSGSQLTVIKDGSVNLNVIGNYPVKYNVTDLSSNKSIDYIRTYKVVDRVKPVITLIGPSVANTYRWKVYDDMGATIDDNYYKNLAPTVSGFVDVNLPGIYYFTFNVTDPSGNVADEKKRIINVKESVSGIVASEFEKGLNVYPNPNTGKFTLEVKMEDAQEMSIVIFDMLGNKVKDLANEKIATGSYNFDLNNLSAGNYMIQFATDKEIVTKKLTVLKK